MYDLWAIPNVSIIEIYFEEWDEGATLSMG